jgi:hypothetical protein
VVECFLAKEDVAGSTPVSRSNNLNLNYLRIEICKLHTTVRWVLAVGGVVLGLVFVPRARYPSGKGEVCKTFMRRFDPDPRLQHFKRVSPRDGGFLLFGVLCMT